MAFVLTAENYYSQEANERYMSVSQFKDFAGTYGKMRCEFYAMEKLSGRWFDKKTLPLMIGSYVDSYFEGTLGKFKEEIQRFLRWMGHCLLSLNMPMKSLKESNAISIS